MFLAMPCLSWLATFKRKKRKKKERERKKNIGKKRQEKKERKEERREGNYKFTFFPSYFLHPFLVLEVSLFSPHLLNGGPVLPLQHFCKSKRKRKKKIPSYQTCKKDSNYFEQKDSYSRHTVCHNKEHPSSSADSQLPARHCPPVMATVVKCLVPSFHCLWTHI